jgi:hypothetical protein
VNRDNIKIDLTNIMQPPWFRNLSFHGFNLDPVLSIYMATDRHAKCDRERDREREVSLSTSWGTGRSWRRNLLELLVGECNVRAMNGSHESLGHIGHQAHDLPEVLQ